MIGQQPHGLARRAFLRAWLALSAPLLLVACSSKPDSTRTSTNHAEPTSADASSKGASAASPAANQGAAQAAPTQARAAQALQPTPACADDDHVTLSMTEGPNFTPNSPERMSLLEPGITGTTMVVTGYVLTTKCMPVARALVDFWQADDRGQYDNVGYRLRGHQFTDEAGRYSLETIVPGLYPGRTRHLHVKVQAPNQKVLTTQLFFPGEPRNNTDGIFNRALLIAVQDTSAGKVGEFRFVLNVS
jgi:protocatechuate 3,4-dioxygenase beta subunit